MKHLKIIKAINKAEFNPEELEQISLAIANINHQESAELEVTSYDGRTYETDDYAFEATRILQEDGTPYDDQCSIEVTDKRTKPWKEEYLDNAHWMIGVLENDSESMVEANTMFNKHGIAEFRAVVRDLINVEWLPQQKT